MMTAMGIDPTKLKQEELYQLNEAVKRTAPRVIFWYELHSAWRSEIDELDIATQTKALSDYDKQYMEGKPDYASSNTWDLERVKVSKLNNKIGLTRSILRLKDWQIRVYNLRVAKPTIVVGDGKTDLVLMTGNNYGNVCKGFINFREATARVNEEDRGLVNRLGFSYFPTESVS